MDDFLVKFFFCVYERKYFGNLKESYYCKYDDQGLQFFMFLFYLVGFVVLIFVFFIIWLLGCKVSMFIVGLVFLVGFVFNVVVMNLVMLIIGCMLLGVGVGFVNQVVGFLFLVLQ